MKIKSVSKKSVILMEFDWVLFIATICLSVFGIVMIYSATRTLQSNTNVIVQSVLINGYNDNCIIYDVFIGF